MSRTAIASHGIASPVIMGPRTRFMPQERSVEVHDNFVHSAVSITANEGPWFATLANSSTATYGDVAGGALLLTTDTAGTDSAVVTSPGEWVSFNVSRRIAFEVTFQMDTAALSGYQFFGFTEGVATGVDGATILGLAHIGFSIVNAVVSFTFASDATATTTATGLTCVAATDYTLSCEYDGSGTYRAWQDGTRTNLSTVATTNPDDLMSPMMACENSAVAAAEVVTVKDIWYYVE